MKPARDWTEWKYRLVKNSDPRLDLCGHPHLYPGGITGWCQTCRSLAVDAEQQGQEIRKPTRTEMGRRRLPPEGWRARTEEDLVRRARRAYFRSEGANAVQPSKGGEFEERDGKAHVTLSNTRGVLAVYRVHSDGSLRRVKDE